MIWPRHRLKLVQVWCPFSVRGLSAEITRVDNIYYELETMLCLLISFLAISLHSCFPSNNTVELCIFPCTCESYIPPSGEHSCNPHVPHRGTVVSNIGHRGALLVSTWVQCGANLTGFHHSPFSRMVEIQFSNMLSKQTNYP